MKTKTYPANFRKLLSDHNGLTCDLLWEIPGPKNTGVAWISAYNIKGTVCIVQTYQGGGWEAYTPNHSTEIVKTLDDVTARCVS